MRTLLIFLLFLTNNSFATYHLKNTYYYYIDENDYILYKQNTPVLSMSGDILAMVSSVFYKDLKMEGSGKTRDGKMLNFAGLIDGEVRFKFTTNEYGTGVGDCALKPYKTIAVDPKVIPFGSTVFIKETKGMLMPDQSIHDGYWLAEDTGSAIVGNRIDIFVGDDRKGKYLDLANIKHMQALTVEITNNPEPNSCVYHINSQP